MKHALPRVSMNADTLELAFGDAFAKSMAVFAAELLSQLQHRKIEVGSPRELASEVEEGIALLKEAPDWVREGYEKARANKKKASKLPSDEPRMRGQVIRSRLLLALRKQNMTQSELARRLKKSPAVLSRILHTPERSRLPTLERIARELDVDLSDLFSGVTAE